MDYFFLFLQTPDLPDYLIPRLKMRFKDVEKAREFYNRYARHAGFGVRKTGEMTTTSILFAPSKGYTHLQFQRPAGSETKHRRGQAAMQE